MISFILFVFYVIRYFETVCSTSSDAQKTAKIEQVTAILAAMLNESVYDRTMRPFIGQHPLTVNINMYVRTMGPIVENSMKYSLDCYFRQKWHDPRLNFTTLSADSNITELSLGVHTLDMIWKPDTFFLNGKNSYLHTITVPNKLLRISRDGHVLYSMRITILADCPMFFRKFPLDVQYCSLVVGSYGYNNKEMVYHWIVDGKRGPVSFDDFSIAQFVLNRDWYHFSEENATFNHVKGEESVLELVFELKRSLGFYILQVYLPCYMVVVISWITFWINREATPARVTLGITTMLTASTLLLTGKEGLPQFDYATALDVFMLKCFCFVFAALLEFAGVHYFTITNSGGGEKTLPSTLVAFVNNQTDLNFMFPGFHVPNGGATKKKKKRHLQLFKFNPTTSNFCTLFLYCLCGSRKYKTAKILSRDPGAINSVSRIDTIARVLFPASFITINAMYWILYLYIVPEPFQHDGHDSSH